jgi:hypothetical protein
MRKPFGLVVAFAAGLAVVGLAVAGANRNWSTHASGTFEVPAHEDSQGQGQAIFHLSEDGSSLEYKLIASNIDNVFMAHIHANVPGQNGPIVLWLYPTTTPNQPADPGAGRTDGVLVTGTATAANLTGPLTNHSLSDLIALMDNGGAYVNFHTNDGVAPPNTGPGDFPGGEIRGDIH